MEIQKYCVYNQTRESFLSLGVTVVDSAVRQLKLLMEDLSVRADNGLWLMPFRGIPASRDLSPVDLIYLDADFRVLLVVESFPNAAFEPLKAQASSALVLAPHTVFSSQTQLGDQLLICIGEEMERRLERFTAVPVAVPRYGEIASEGSTGAEAAEAASMNGHGVEMQIAHQRLVERDSTELETISSASWFTKFLRWLSTDRRSAKRHPLPGLVAYYWTGGNPQAYHIGDISASGIYLLTDERWFPGTMILMTLQRTNTDGEDPDDYIAVQTRVTRWGNDGIGLSFVPSKAVDLHSGQYLPETGVGKKALLRFVQRVLPADE
jgi:hypothetical protein